MFTYPVTLKRDTDGSLLVGFPDVPMAHSYGEDEEEALERAVDALETAFMALMSDRQPIPRPSRLSRRSRSVTLPALTAAKLGLYEAMRSARIRKAELARRLSVHMPQVDRLLDLRHASRLEQVEAALRALGKELVIDIRDAAA
jgi:antitoxin HicB